MKNYLRYLIPSLSILSLSACAPSLGVRMSVPGLPEQTQEQGESKRESAEANAGVKIRVSPFMDARASDTVVVIDGRQVESEGQLGNVVQEGFERYLRDLGIKVVLTQAPTVEGEIVEWRAKVTPKFPASEAKATAKVKVSVRDPQTKFVRYRGTFSGEATATHPFLKESDIQQLLSEAMSGALTAALKDDVFLSQIGAAPQG